MTYEYMDRRKPTTSEALYWDASDEATARVISALADDGVTATYIAPVKEVIVRNVLVRKGVPANLKVLTPAGTVFVYPGEFLVELFPKNWYPMDAATYDSLYSERWAQFRPAHDTSAPDVVLDMAYGDAYERVQTALVDSWNADAVTSDTLHIVAEYVLMALTSEDN